MPTLTLELVKAFLRYDADNEDQDETLNFALQAGVQWVEQYTGRTIAGADPETVPAPLLHGVLLYAGAFDRLRDGEAATSLAPAMIVCDPYRRTLV